MTIWLREVMGWILLGLGVATFAMCYVVFLLERWIFEAAIFATMGVFVFRAGMHLLKVATAARIAGEVRLPNSEPRTLSKPLNSSLSGRAPAGRSRGNFTPGPDVSR